MPAPKTGSNRVASPGVLLSRLMAQELEAWQSDSFSAHAIIAKPDEQQVYKVLLKMLDRWNAHDIEAYMGGLLEVS